MATLFLLISSFLHALWNTLLKNQARKSLILFHSIIWATLLAWILALTFDGLNYGEAFHLTLFSGVLEGLYFITLTKALNQASLAVSYSVMRALSMLISWMLSSVLLHETLSLVGGLGVCIILIGLTLPLFQNKNHNNSKLFWSYLCALTITGYNFIYNRALHLGAQPLILFATSLTVSLPFIYSSINAQDKKITTLFAKTNIHWGASILIGTIILGSFSTFLYGLRDTMPALAITIRNASIAFALIMSNFLGEKLKRHDYIVLIFILIGVFIVSTVTLFH